MKKIKTAVIGVGSIADYAHIPNCFNIEAIDLVAFCDINREQLKLMQKKYNVSKGYVSHRELLECENLDAVIIASSANSHCEILIDCIDKGLHIYVEKPLTINYEEALKVYNHGKNYDKKIQVGYQLRFLPNHNIAIKNMSKETIGELLYIHMRSETLVIKPEETLLVDYTTHLIDLLRHYTKRAKVDDIFCVQYGPEKHKGVLEGATLIFNFTNGLRANIETIWVPDFSWGSVNRRVEILGTHGRITSDQTGPAITIDNVKSTRSQLLGAKTVYPKSMLLPYVPISDQSYYGILKDFTDSIINNRETTITLKDGFEAIKIADCAKRSHETRSVIKLSNYDNGDYDE